MHALYRLIAVGFAGSLLWAACGGDDSNGGSEDVTSLCKDTCNKLVACWDGGIPLDCNSMCAPRDGGSGTGGGETCKDPDAQIAHLKGCLQKECKDLTACFESAPCNGGGGSGGAGGAGGAGGSTGGSGGTGGSGLGDGGASCAALLTCCNAITNETLKPACLQTHMLGIDAVCAATLNGYKASMLCP